MTTCNGDCARCFIKHPDQPFGEEFSTSDGIFIKQMVIPKAGTFVPQHVHTFDHTSMLARGSVRIEEDGVIVGEFTAPKMLFIKAGVKHLFESLEDETLIYCIHNVSRKGSVEISAEHHILG